MTPEEINKRVEDYRKSLETNDNACYYYEELLEKRKAINGAISTIKNQVNEIEQLKKELYAKQGSLNAALTKLKDMEDLREVVNKLRLQIEDLQESLRECGNAVDFKVDPQDGFHKHCLVSQYVVGSVNRAKMVLAENRELVAKLREERDSLTEQLLAAKTGISALAKENESLRWANAAKDCSFTVIDALTNKCKELEKSNTDLSHRLRTAKGVSESVDRAKLEKIYQKLGKDVVESWSEAQT